jgi:hypothetical protein
MATRYDNARAVFGSDTFSKIESARVLVVGAGGIGECLLCQGFLCARLSVLVVAGCELLKNLVMTGFKSIDVRQRARPVFVPVCPVRCAPLCCCAGH